MLSEIGDQVNSVRLSEYLKSLDVGRVWVLEEDAGRMLDIWNDWAEQTTVTTTSN